MTDTLKRAFDKAAQLSEEQQNAWGETWLGDLSTEEIEDQIASGARPIPSGLQAILDEADADVAAGRVRPMDELFR